MTAAREEIEPVVETLETELAGDETFVGLAGSPITREESLNATQRALQISMPVAVLACFMVAWVFMRSFSYALVTIIPIILVSAWLYAFMYVAGFDLNFVTATIGAISIGVGIDYAIHFTMRYRQELATQTDADAALSRAGAETGGALAASAVSSIVGFLIMAFAPMPLFATYGLLTAVMIFFALAAALLVLPSLLRILASSPANAE